MTSDIRKPKVLYMAGAGRSGSTVLGSILGQIKGFFYGGELSDIGRKSLGENRLCGFGMPLRESEVWQNILQHGFGDLDRACQELTATWTYDPLRTIKMLRRSNREQFLREHAGFVDALGRLYQGIYQAGEGQVIVDSSHVPLYGYLLSNVPQIELYVVHLIRDPRAVAYSWLRQKVQPDKVQEWKMRKLPPAFVSTMWNAANICVERFWPAGTPRLMRLRYEDFVARPRTEVERILGFLDESPEQSPFVSEHEVVLGPTPTVFGNPDRFRFGQIPVKADDQWSREMSLWQRAQVDAVCWPWMWRYGYWSGKRSATPERMERGSVAPRKPDSNPAASSR